MDDHHVFTFIFISLLVVFCVNKDLFMQKQPPEVFLWGRCSRVLLRVASESSVVENSFHGMTGFLVRRFTGVVLHR